jgi:hypothetical protein
MKDIIKFPFIVILLFFLLTGCEEEQEEVTSNPDVIIDAFDYSEWTYYSFESGESYTEPVESENYLKSLDWDIAFHRYNFRLNGGKSGVGEAGVMLLGTGERDDYSEVPFDNYVQDDSISIMFSGGMPPTWHTVPGSVYLEGYYEDPDVLDTLYTGVWRLEGGAPPIYHPSNHVYAIKTAKGNYAIVKFEDYYDEWGVAGYVSFSYKYNADGSNKF